MTSPIGKGETKVICHENLVAGYCIGIVGGSHVPDPMVKQTCGPVLALRVATSSQMVIADAYLASLEVSRAAFGGILDD